MPTVLSKLRHQIRTVRNRRQQPVPGLYTFVSPLDFADLQRPVPGSERAGPPGVWQAPAPSSPSIIRPAGQFNDDPDGVAVIGPLLRTPVPLTPQFIATASHVNLLGERAYTTADFRLFNDQAWLKPADKDAIVSRFAQSQWLERTLMLPTDMPDVFRWRRNKRWVKPIAGEIVSLCSVEGENYGSFLFRTVPKLIGLDDVLKGRRILIPAHTPTMQAMLEMIGLPRDRLILHNTSLIYRLEHAIIPSLRNAYAGLDPETVAFYAEFRERFGSRTSGRRIAVSRKGVSGSYAAENRVMLNEDAVMEALEAEGFEIIRPHLMTMEEQIEAFSSADVVVGASGAALFNTVFCRPGTRVLCIESEPHWYVSHANLFGTLGLAYGVLQGAAVDRDFTTHHKPFRVNVAALIGRVRQL